MAIVNSDLLIPYLDKYKIFIDGQERKNSNRIFNNSDEDYKRDVVIKAADQLKARSWKTSDIGSGVIGICAIKAVHRNENLIGRFQVSGFADKIKEKRYEAEQLLYDMYHEHKEQKCFDPICALFGRKYDLVGYLYFILDPERYLPIRSSIFDEVFEELGIDLRTKGRCSWENYQEFLATVSEVRNVMREYYQIENIDLLDAHSFLWSLNSQVKKNKVHVDEERIPQEDHMVTEGSEVFHKEYGKGTIIMLTDEKIYVDFTGRQRIFPNPEAFMNKYLELL